MNECLILGECDVVGDGLGASVWTTMYIRMHEIKFVCLLAYLCRLVFSLILNEYKKQYQKQEFYMVCLKFIKLVSVQLDRSYQQ